MKNPQASNINNRLANLLVRGAVTLVNAANKLQTLQVSLLSDEAKDDVEHLEPYGFASKPLVGAEAVVVFFDGDRSHGAALVVSDRRYRPNNLQDGDSAQHDSRGQYIMLTKDGIKIVGINKPVIITNVPQVTVTGGDVIADGISLKNHKHGGVQPGSGQTGEPV